MELSPRVFWRLTPHEFWIKWRAFTRAEDRAESARIRQALRTTQLSDGDRRKLERNADALKRYPLKKWLLPDG